MQPSGSPDALARGRRAENCKNCADLTLELYGKGLLPDQDTARSVSLEGASGIADCGCDIGFYLAHHPSGLFDPAVLAEECPTHDTMLRDERLRNSMSAQYGRFCDCTDCNDLADLICLNRVCKESVLPDRQANATQMCETCTPAMTCTTPDMRVERLAIKEGFWRVNEVSTQLFPCVPAEVCLGADPLRSGFAETLCAAPSGGPCTPCRG